MANEIKKDSSEWHVIKVKRFLELVSGNEEVEVPILQRDDGLTVERIGMDRERNEIFLFKGNFGEVKFQANRWNFSKNEPSQTYVVLLFPPYIEKSKEILLRSMSKNIESALLNYPLSQTSNFVPVHEVVFQVERGHNPDTVLQAREI